MFAGFGENYEAEVLVMNVENIMLNMENYMLIWNSCDECEEYCNEYRDIVK